MINYIKNILKYIFRYDPLISTYGFRTHSSYIDLFTAIDNNMYDIPYVFWLDIYENKYIINIEYLTSSEKCYNIKYKSLIFKAGKHTNRIYDIVFPKNTNIKESLDDLIGLNAKDVPITELREAIKNKTLDNLILENPLFKNKINFMMILLPLVSNVQKIESWLKNHES